jgi:hypothetical protein
MPVYPSPSGGEMTVANRAEAEARGWTPSMGTFGTRSQEDSGSSSGSGTGGGGVLPGGTDLASLQKFFGQTAGFSREELAEKARQFNETLAQTEQQWEREGKPRLQIDQDLQSLRRWQAEQDIALQQAQVTGYYNAPSAAGGGLAAGPTQDQYTQARTQQLMGMGFDAQRAAQTATAEWNQGYAQSGNVAGGLPPGISFTSPAAGPPGSTPGTPTLALQQLYGGSGAPQPGQATLEAEMQRRQATLAELAQKQQYEIATGQLDLARQTQAQANAIAQGTLGLNYLTTASQMGGPSDVFNQIDFLRGARARGDVPQFLGALASNTQLPGFSGAGTTPQEAMTAAGLAAKLGGTAPITSYNPDQALAQIGSIFQRGATGLTPGSLERLDPNELAVLKAGGQKLGYDPDAWLRSYQRAGIGQQASGPV